MPKTTVHIEEQLASCEERRRHVKRLLRQTHYTAKDQGILKVFMTANFLMEHYENILRPYRQGAQYGFNRDWKRVPIKRVYIKNDLSDDDLEMLKLMYHIVDTPGNLPKELGDKVLRLLGIREHEFKKYASTTKPKSKRCRR